MFATAVRCFAKKCKPKMKPTDPKLPPEQTLTISRAIFDIIREHGPLTIGGTWDRIKEAGIKGLNSKGHMKTMLRWMKERHRLKLICNHVGVNKQFLYTAWFTNPPKAAGNVNVRTSNLKAGNPVMKRQEGQAS